jgi:hypothetical protein
MKNPFKKSVPALKVDMQVKDGNVYMFLQSGAGLDVTMIVNAESARALANHLTEAADAAEGGEPKTNGLIRPGSNGLHAV